MTSRTIAYRNQHRELTRLAESIPPEPAAADARSVRRVLDGLNMAIAGYLRLKSHLLYPWAQCQGSSRLQLIAQESAQVSEAFLAEIRALNDRWSRSAIAADPGGFANAWHFFFTRFQRHLAAEEQGLFSAIEEHESGSLAS